MTKATPVETSLSVPITGLRPSGRIIQDGCCTCSAGSGGAGRGVVPSSRLRLPPADAAAVREMPPARSGPLQFPASLQVTLRWLVLRAPSGDWEGGGRAHRRCLPGYPGPSGDSVDAVFLRRSGSRMGRVWV